MDSFDVSSLAADLKGKSVLVTGAARGIGKGIALKLASLGANIAVNYTANEAAAKATVAEIQKLGVKAIAIKADVSKSTEATDLVEKAVKAFGPLYGLVNNAGVFLGAPVDKETDEQYHKMIGVNVNGTFFVTRAAVPHLENGGIIINISTCLTKGPFPGVSVYTLSKGAVEAFARALAVELAPRKIRVNTVSPGFTASDMLASAGDAMIAVGIEASPFKRLGTPGDIAESVAFLVVPRSGAWITSSNIVSSGGVGYSI